ncbi:MAG: rhodanese-like domain-containing protein [Elusimicrobia bacterium]|nr:rhodanese-like domain-containing protein [Elusimicrobiota bacterium]
MDASWVPLALLASFVLYRWAGGRKARRLLPGLLDRGAVIVDVRTPAEFVAGANPASVNMPLAELGARLGSLDRARPVVVCCASGTRSALAAAILKRGGFREVLDAGPWTNTLRPSAQRQERRRPDSGRP